MANHRLAPRVEARVLFRFPPLYPRFGRTAAKVRLAGKVDALDSAPSGAVCLPSPAAKTFTRADHRSIVGDSHLSTVRLEHLRVSRDYYDRR